MLISQERIAARVAELARQITADHTSGGEAEVTIVPILTGAMIFTADLIRQIPIAMKIGLLTVSSYPGRSLRTQGSQVLGQQLGDLRGRHVLLVDDILDSGGTREARHGPAARAGPGERPHVRAAAQGPAGVGEVPVDYVGFEIPDEFVVGYGLDYNNYYRNLPDIVTLKREVIGRTTTP